MKDLYFESSKELDKYLSESSYLGKGTQGVVYRKGNYVLKRYTLPLSWYDYDELKFRNEEIPDFYFAKAGIYVKNIKNGVISEYADGVSLADRKLSDVEILKLEQAIERLKFAVEKLCNENIRICDATTENILFDGEHFNVIDTLSYFRADHLSQDELRFLNMKNVFKRVFEGIIPVSLYAYLNNSFLNAEAIQDPVYNFEKIAKQLQDVTGSEFNTFLEAKELVMKGRTI